VLILYYTWSEEANTETAAQILQGLTSADIIKVEPATPFPEMNSGEMIAWAGEQRRTPGWPEIKELGVNPADYDFIFVGTPVWFGTLSPPIETMLANTDFGGKQMACFAMANSREGDVLIHFGEKVINAQVKEGIAFRMQSETEVEEKLTQWVKGL
jgi:flavodoxin